MDARQFARGYRRESTDIGNRRQDNPVYEKSEEYSEFFGHLLHDMLSGERPPSEVLTSLSDQLDDYISFVYGDLRDYEIKLTEQGKDYSYRRLNQFNFHWLNIAMIGMWDILTKSNTMTEQRRLEIIRNTQDMLAYDGCRLYAWKDRLADKTNQFAYFGEDFAKIRASVEGRLNERDAGIVLLDIAAANPGLVVVPGPRQFERLSDSVTNDGQSRNADFVVVDTIADRAIGVQMKSHFDSEEKLQEYDPEFIVCLDGRIDLDNHLTTRTTHDSTIHSFVSWAGLVTADHMRKLRVIGKNTSILMQMYPRHEILGNMHAAKVRLGKLAVNRKEIAGKISPRIAKKL